jgi:hypothetical protein
MGKEFYDSGVDGGDFTPFSEVTTWEIHCYNYNNGNGWHKSREASIEGVGTPIITIRYDDDSGGDNDFNDSIVEVAIGQPFSPDTLGTKKHPQYQGDGNYKPKHENDIPSWTPKRKGDQEP